MTAWRPLVVLASAALLAAACGAAGGLMGDDDARAPGIGSQEGETQPMTAGRDYDAVEERFVGDRLEGDDEVVLAALSDIETFWAETFPEVFGCEPACALAPVAGGFHAYGPTTDQPPCGSPLPRYDQIADNAFYCPAADLIAWDTVSLIPTLQDTFGDFALAIVMAHEYGHAIEARAGLGGLTITSEQRADCWAGAWTRWADDGNAENFDVTLTDLDLALAGFLRLRDAVGTPATDPAAHGSAFDRIGAFQEGFRDGAATCAAYDDANIDVIPIRFSSTQDVLSGGNAPFEEVEAFTVDDLDNFWRTTLPRVFGVAWTDPAVARLFPSDGDPGDCGDRAITAAQLEGSAFYCAADDTMAWDEEFLMPELYREIGDFAVSTVIGSQYSVAAQVKVTDLPVSPGPNLQADCFTGAWVASSVIQDRGSFDPERNPDGNVFVLSPGDLDEAVIAFLRKGDPAGATADSRPGTDADQGTAFIRLGAFRTGFLAAYDAGDGAAGVGACTSAFELDG